MLLIEELTFWGNIVVGFEILSATMSVLLNYFDIVGTI